MAKLGGGMLETWLNQAWLFAEAAPGGGSLVTSLLPFIAIGVVFWLLMIRPESRRSADQAKMRENLKKNDRVLTAGGIFGVVVNVQKGAKDVVIRIDENNNTRMRILRSAIAQVVAQDDASSKENSSDE